MSDLYFGEFSTDVTPPHVENPTPSPGTTGLEVNVPVGFDLVDDSYYGPDLAHTTFRLNGEIAYQNGVWSSGYSGTITTLSNGYRFSNITHPDFTGLVFAQVDSQDDAPYPNVMASYIWTFAVAFSTVSKAFLFNTIVSQAAAASSYFQPRVGPIIAGSKGNIAMSATAGSPAVGNSYEVRTTQAGRLDNALDSVRESELDFGSGQITYNEVQNFRGSYTPPGFVVDDGSDIFGLETTFAKNIFSKNAANRYFAVCLCDRDDDSFFIMATRHTTENTDVWSVPKIGHTDGNPVGPVLVSGIVIHSAAKIGDNRYLLAYAKNATGSADAKITFKIVDSDGALVSTPNEFSPIRRNEITTAGYAGLDMLVRDNVIYMVFSYSEDVSTRGLFNVYFAKSSDGAQTWEMINAPGTNELAQISQSIYDDIKTSTYSGERHPKLAWDAADERFLLTFYGYYPGDGGNNRLATCYSTDFATWRRLGLPVFKSSGAAGGSTYDVSEKALGQNWLGRMVRYGGMIFGVASDDEGQYVCRFMNDDSLYGTRRGMLWCEDAAAASPPVGAIIADGDLRDIDGVVYMGASIEPPGSSGTEGIVVHAFGVPTNLPDNTLYSGAYFGVVSKPSADFGWTESLTGSPTVDPTNNGLRILGASTESAYYTRADVPYPAGTSDCDGGIKIKACVIPITDGGLGSVNTQRIRIGVPTQSSTERCFFEVEISTAGIRLRDLLAAVNTDYVASIGETELLIAYFPISTTSAKIRVFINSPGSSYDRWQLIIDTTLTSTTSSAKVLSFGLITTASGASEAYWKYFYYNDRVDNSDYDVTLFTDGLTSYDSATDEDRLTPIPMTPPGTIQPLIDGIEVQWRGTDAYETDSWSFDVDTDFSADNVLKKAPSLGWRSGADTASGLGTMTNEYIELDAALDSMGMFVFDTFVLLNTNFRLATLQANNDGTTWGPAPYEQSIDLQIESGTVTSGVVTRIDSDLMTIEDTSKSWIPHEYVGKYVELEEAFELGLSGAPSNHYRNVAFKIVDNGTNFLVMTTKGLAVDELGTGGSKLPLYVPQGDDYIIYDTKISGITADVQAYRYVRLRITASKAYGDAWSTSNQPNLPNERSWAIGEFDIGKRIELQDDIDYGYTETEQSNADVNRGEAGEMVVNVRGKARHIFKLLYSTLRDYDHDLLDYLYEAVSESDQPFWYVPYIEEEPFNVYLVQALDSHGSSKFLPDHQKDDLVFEEVV